MKGPVVTTLDLPAIDAVFDMSGGYVLGFSNRTFAMFFAELGIDIDADFPEGSKANRMRGFLVAAEPARAVQVLEALLAHRGTCEGDESSRHLEKVNSLVARLRGTQISITPVTVTIEALSLAYVHELETKTDQRLAARTSKAPLPRRARCSRPFFSSWSAASQPLVTTRATYSGCSRPSRSNSASTKTAPTSTTTSSRSCAGLCRSSTAWRPSGTR
jgi:hypothetical protein